LPARFLYHKTYMVTNFEYLKLPIWVISMVNHRQRDQMKINHLTKGKMDNNLDIEKCRLEYVKCGQISSIVEWIDRIRLRTDNDELSL